MRPGTGSASLLRMATRLASLSPWSRALADQLEPEPFQVGGCHSHHRHCRGPRGRAKRPGRPMRSLGSCRRSPAMRASDRRRTGTLGMLPPSKADSEARQELSRACEDKAPAGSRWSRPGLCRAAGGRGMGGTRPAQAQRSILARVPGLGLIFLLRDRMQGEGSRPGAQLAAPRSTAWVVRSGAKSSTLSMASICANRARARCTRLLIVPTRHPQISAASS